MHPTARQNIKHFFDIYNIKENCLVAEIGSYDNHAHNKDYIPTNLNYTGIDIFSGPNVDIVLEDPYKFPIEDNKFDFVIATSVFEHTNFFWLTILEMTRILKPEGLLYINVPTNCFIHRYPRDNWRFYPDAGLTLKDWINRNGYNSSLMESYTSFQDPGSFTFNDFVAIIIKDKSYAENYPNRIVNNIQNYHNGLIDDGKVTEKTRSNGYLNWEVFTEDHIKLLQQAGSWENYKNVKDDCY